MEPIVKADLVNPPVQVARAPYQRFTIEQENGRFVIQTASTQTTSKIDLLFFEKVFQVFEKQEFLNFKDREGNITRLIRKHQVRFYMEHMFHFVVEQFADQFDKMKKMKKKKITVEENSGDSERAQFIQGYLRAEAHLCVFNYPEPNPKLPYYDIKKQFRSNHSNRLIPFLTNLIWTRCAGVLPTQSEKEESMYQLILSYLQDLQITFKGYLDHLSRPAYKASSEFSSVGEEIMFPILLNHLPFAKEQSEVEEKGKQEKCAEPLDMLKAAPSSITAPIKYILDLVTHSAFKEFFTGSELQALLDTEDLNEGDYFFSLSPLSYPHLAFHVVVKDDETSSLEIKNFKVERNQQGNFIFPLQKKPDSNNPQQAIVTTNLDEMIDALNKHQSLKGKLIQVASFEDRYTQHRADYLRFS